MLRTLLRLMRAAPLAFERAHLRWALSELQRRDPMHPDVPYIVLRIHTIERLQ